MREILFRGKRLDNGEWVEGDSLIHSMYRKGDVCIGVVEGMEIYSVDPATVGQFTGLTDKNGKKIFEGDIVTHGYENDYGEFYDNYRVSYSDVSSCFELVCIYPNNSTKRLTKRNVLTQHTEIIGNIHDNPELLGGTE